MVTLEGQEAGVTESVFQVMDSWVTEFENHSGPSFYQKGTCSRLNCLSLSFPTCKMGLRTRLEIKEGTQLSV